MAAEGEADLSRGVVGQVEVAVELEQLDKTSHPAARAVNAKISPLPASLIRGVQQDAKPLPVAEAHPPEVNHDCGRLPFAQLSEEPSQLLGPVQVELTPNQHLRLASRS